MRQYPSEILVKPHLELLNPDVEWDDRDMVTGHIVAATNFIFPESGARHVFFGDSSRLKSWLSEHGYVYVSDLKNSYMATSGLHGYYCRQLEEQPKQ